MRICVCQLVVLAHGVLIKVKHEAVGVGTTYEPLPFGPSFGFLALLDSSSLLSSSSARPSPFVDDFGRSNVILTGPFRFALPAGTADVFELDADVEGAMTAGRGGGGALDGPGVSLSDSEPESEL